MDHRFVSPSILAADYLNLERDVRLLERWGADWVHVDVMDAHFVRPLTFGPPLIERLRRVTTLPLDVHLMTDVPEPLAEDAIAAGADSVTFHAEAPVDTRALLARIRALGAKAGLSVKPGTPVETLLPYLEEVDMVLIMTVEPGYGGQELIPETLAKAACLRALKPDLLIEADGGIHDGTIGQVAASGVNVFVAGSATFQSPDPAAMFARWRQM